MSSTRPLAGRAALVTGAGRGIGKQIALRLAREGARLVLAARSADALAATASEIHALGGEAIVAPTDVGDPDQVARLAERATEQLGPMDVLVNNSGIAGPTAELWRVEPHEWEDTFRVNVTGVYLVCRAFLPRMLARGGGSIIVIGSATGKRPAVGRTPYAASKMALVGLVRTLASEVGPRGIRVNLVSPGPVAGDRLEAVIERQAAARGVSVDQLRPEFLEDSPLRQVTAPEEVAEAVAFLAGDSAGAITGEDVNVSSGWVMY